MGFMIRAAMMSAAFLFPVLVASQTVEEHHRRADLALETFLIRFLSHEQTGYLRASFPDDGRATHYWTFAQAWDAVLDGVERTGGQRFKGFVADFFGLQAERGWYSGWYDDMNWMVLALMRAHDLTGERKYLEVARDLYRVIQEEGWDESCCGGTPGGIWWDMNHSQKATAANAGPVISGVRLAERTGNPAYLTFAEKVYAYWRQNMVDPTTFQVTDHINTDGTKVYWKFSYNEGLMIGAALELHRATGRADYLADAHGFAAFLVAQETTSTVFGRVLDDGGPLSCTGDCHQFKGIAYRYLMLLQERDPRPAYAAVLEASAIAIWELSRHPDLGLFGVSWAGPPGSVFSEPQVCAGVMVLNIFARAAGPYPPREVTPLHYEAEEAAFLGLEVGNTEGDFSGWGYLTGWYHDTRRVDFVVEAPRAGAYELEFEYAAAESDAVRRLEVNGEILVPQLNFPTLGFTDRYQQLYLQAELRAGTNTISLIFDYLGGSAGYLNLDYLALRPMESRFRRGDANLDRELDLSDSIRVLSYLFLGEPSGLECDAAADANDDGGIDISDPISLLEFLFLGGSLLPPPGPGCGVDPTPDPLECESFPGC